MSDYIEIYEAAIEKWGRQSQGLMAMSECGELVAALGRNFVQNRGNDSEVIG